MAKSRNLYTRGLSQRLAGAVWFQNKGQTLVRELPAAVSNPQTAAQMEQRAKLANLVAAYRANQFWMHWGAFQDKKETWSDYNAFVSANQAIAPVYMTKDSVAAGATVVAPYVVSSGTLPRVNCVINVDTLISDIYVAADFTINDATPVNTLSESILASNNLIQEGDQISVIINIQQSTADVPYITARAFELILDTEDTRTLAAIGLSGLFIAETQGGNNCLSVQMPSEQCAATIILSRESSTGLKVSSQTLVLTPAQETYLAAYRTASARAASFRSYGATGSQNFLSGGYSTESSEGVSLPQQILSVNGKAAGQYLGTGTANNNTLTIVMMQPVSNGASVSSVVNPTDAYPQVSTSINNGNVLISTTTSGSGNAAVISSISVTIDEETFNINFAETSGGGGEIDE